jgi:hypothetical protein
MAIGQLQELIHCTKRESYGDKGLLLEDCRRNEDERQRVTLMVTKKINMKEYICLYP